MNWTTLEAWLTTRKLLANRTCAQYRRRAQQADRWTRRHRGRGLVEADASDLTAWLDSLPATPSTRNHALKALRQVAAWMMDSRMRLDDPTVGLGRVAEPRGLPRPCPAPDRLLTAAHACGPRAAAFVGLLLYSGLRLSEARLLTWDRIEGDWIDVVGKGARSRTVPVHPQLADALAVWHEQCADAEWVFPSPRGGPVSESGVRWWWRHITERAGLRGVTPHQCRHRYGTDVYRATGDLAVTQDALGHASPQTTRIYALVEPARVASAVAALDY